MALATHNITGSLKDALQAVGRGRATFRPYGSHDVRTDPTTGDAYLGSIVEDIETMPSPYPLTAGPWRITIESTTRIAGRPEFSPIVVTFTMDRDYSWQEIIDLVATDVPVTPTVLQQAQAAASSAEASALEVEAAVAGVPTMDTMEATFAARREVPATTRRPSPATVARAYAGVAADERPGWLTADGSTVFTSQSVNLKRSFDEGETWELMRTFSTRVSAVRELPNGELMATTYNDETGGVPGAVWVTTDYPTLGAGCTWTQTLTLTSKSLFNGWYSLSTPMHHHDDLPDGVNMGIIVGVSYGAKTLPDNARKAYVSEDYGMTWRVIYDPAEAVDYHGHGAEYDPWFDRIWLSNGDSTNRSLRFSDDWRNATPTWTVVSDTAQPVGIVAMPNCILLGSDDPPDGVWRLERDETQPNKVGPLEVVHQIGTSTTGAAHYTRQIYKAPGGPVLFPFTAVNIDGGDDRGHLIATHDGKTFHELWQDDQQYATYPQATMGLFTAVGPTPGGKILGTLADERNPYSKVVMDAPVWPVTDALTMPEADARYLLAGEAVEGVGAPLVAAPSGFSLSALAMPNVYRVGSGRFRTDLDVQALRPAAGTTYYVHPDAPASGNTGLSSASPIRISAAWAMADVGTIVYAPGEYSRATHVTGYTSKSINHLAAGPGVKVTGWNPTGSTVWTLHSGSIYKTSRSATAQVVDVQNRTTWGDYTKYEQKADAASITGPGQWAIVGSDVYVWCIGNTDLSVGPNRVQIRLGMSATDTGLMLSGGVHYARGIEFEGNAYGAIVTGGATLIAEDCAFRYSLTDAVPVDGSKAILVRCEASSAATDGFSYTGASEFIEIDCHSHHNGLQGVDNTYNATTCHMTCRGLRVNGDYHDVKGPVVADVNSARSWNLGCRSGGSTAPDTQNHGYRADAVGYEGDPAVMWLDECTSDTATYGYKVTGGAIMHLHATKPGNRNAYDTSGAGTLDYYDAD